MDRHEHPTVTTGAVEITQEDVLPGRKPQSPIADRDHLTGTHETRLDVGRTIVVHSVVSPAPGRNQPVEAFQYVRKGAMDIRDLGQRRSLRDKQQ